MNPIITVVCLFIVGGLIGYLRLQAIKLEKFRSNLKNGDIVIVKIKGKPTKCVVCCGVGYDKIRLLNTETGSEIIVCASDVYPN